MRHASVHTTTVLIVSNDSPAALIEELDAHGIAVRVLGPDVALTSMDRADVALVDEDVDGVLAVVTRVAKHATATFIRCGEVDLATVDAAIAAGARGLVARGTELEVITARTTSFEPGLDHWRAECAARVVGETPGLYEALRAVRAVADTCTTVLIGGPSGSGKELLARAIHAASPRRSGPFVAVNAAAIPEHLVETELFGHVRGAFTGATVPREGKVVSASGGTLFLDEIGDMPLAMQAKLLRVLQEREVTPVGADHSVPVDVRVVAATHRDLAQLVADGKFREDLYYRLSVMTIDLPALRERKADILPIAVHLLRQHNASLGRATTGFNPSAVAALVAHEWPGNGRELGNAIERAVVMRRTGRITAGDLGLGPKRVALGTPPRGFPAIPAPVAAPSPAAHAPASMENVTLKAALENLERQLIEQALERAGGNRSEAAALLGLNRTTLVEKLRKLS